MGKKQLVGIMVGTAAATFIFFIVVFLYEVLIFLVE
jgi:hypothetical protein|tara:strand:- start:534 stop:641 length:108 start_codon:yes stop_codon:yes gene_type:complete